MDKKYKEILKSLEMHGFVAYIVGGYVRDKLLGKESLDIDIITNATPKDIKGIFNNIYMVHDEYGASKIKIGEEIIDITTFRKDLSYKNNKPVSIEYTSSLEEDLKRRDFIMNTLCMDSEENIIDLFNAKKDIENKIIRPVKDVNILFKEDKTRIIRALRFMCELNFKLDKSIINYIKENGSDLKEINIIRKKEELDKIFKTKNVTPFLAFLKEFNLEEYFGIKSNNFKETDTIIGVWSQLEYTSDYNFSKYDKENIKIIKELINKKEITKYDLYNYGLYPSLIAADILGIDKKEINLLYTNLPIKGIIDLNITTDEICEILNITPSYKLGKILKIIEKEVIEGKLKNKKEDIINKLKNMR